MPTFVYEALNSVGQPVKGTVDALNTDEAVQKVRAQGHYPTKIKEKAVKSGPQQAAASAGGAQRRRSVGKVKPKLLTTLTRQLSTLIDAGLPIVRSLDILEQQQKPGTLRVAVRLIKEDVMEGATLSDAMKRHPRAFDALYTNMIRAGELGGVLDVILQRLADFREKSQALKSKIRGAMVYPTCVIFFAACIVTLLLWLVVPKFETIFADQGEKLPGVTLALLGFSKWISQQYGWLVIFGSPFLIFLLVKLARSSDSGRHAVDKLLLSIPVLGQIAEKGSVARFCRTLGTLLTAGVPILEAINITRETSGNEVFSRALAKVHDAIREGESFATPLRQTRVVDPMVVNMIDVGEETGELDKMLAKIADTYDDEIEVLVEAMTSLLEPVMIIVLGGIVAFIVIALFMPMVEMLQNMQ